MKGSPFTTRRMTMICANPRCGDKVVACIAREQDGKIFCGVTCVRDYNLQSKEERIEEVFHELAERN